jgi:hypothetical protein
MGNLKGLAMAGQDTLPSSAAVKPAPTAVTQANDPPLVLSTASATPAQKRLALAAVVLPAAAFAVTAALSTVPVGYVGKFVPAYATAMFVVTCITSALLFVQFSIVRSHALLAISSGYLFTALITVPWALTFPDLLGETGMSSGAWGFLSRLWHLGIPLAVIGYVLLKDDVTLNRVPRASLSIVIVAGITAVLLAVASLAWFATISNELVPKVPPASIDFERPLTYLNVVTMFVTFLALALLWSRWRSVLDLWLMVTLCGWLIELSLIFLVGGRMYVLGGYAGRLYGCSRQPAYWWFSCLRLLGSTHGSPAPHWRSAASAGRN